MEGKSFELMCKEGDIVNCGQPILKFNSSEIKKAGYSNITAVLITNSDNYSEINVEKFGNVLVSEKILFLK